MGILKGLFGSKSKPEEKTFEVVENRWSIDEHRYQVRVRKGGREIYAEDLFQAAVTSNDLRFDRFFLLSEKQFGLHFAPSLREGVDWFTGRKLPKDGFNTIWWGERVNYECEICKTKRHMPLKISRVERLAVATVVPRPMEIVGWRVTGVESELTGKGVPTKKMDDYKTVPVIKWDNFPNQYLCSNCARQLAEVGRGGEVVAYFVFEAK